MISKSISFSLDSNGEVKIFGIPFDSTSTLFPGQRFGPTSIRLASYHLETFDYDYKIELQEFGVCDLGDIHVFHGNSKKTFENVRNFVKGLNQKFIALGGEHSVSIPIVEALKPDLCVILDAHLDLRDEYLGDKYSHACTARRIHEVCDTSIYGFRECSKEEHEYLESSKIMAKKKLENPPKDRKIYLSIDMDVFDPSLCPRVGNPVPWGFFFEDVWKFVEKLIDENKVLGVDFTEVTSKKIDVTSITAAKLIFKVLSKFYSR